jgi:hypothetical protein
LIHINENAQYADRIGGCAREQGENKELMSDFTTPGPPAATELNGQQMQALRSVPSGAVALSGIAVLLLLLAWLAIYIFIYLPRGMVG